MYFSFPFLRELLQFMFFLFITHCCFTQGLDRPQPPFSSIYIYIYIYMYIPSSFPCCVSSTQSATLCCMHYVVNQIYPVLSHLRTIVYITSSPLSYFSYGDNSGIYLKKIQMFYLLKNPSKFTHSDSTVYNCQDMEAT